MFFLRKKKVKIIYCKPCGYTPNAQGMKEALEDQLKNKVAVSLVAADQGIYDVYVDEKLVFSAHRELRLPTTEEIMKQLG